MKYLIFKDIFEEYSKLVKTKEVGGSHKEGQVREKFTEIAEAVGINLALLRQYKKEDGMMYISPKATAPYRFPEISKGFVLHILMHHTDSDYQELRRGNFEKVPVDTMIYLIRGFETMLSALGHDEKTVQEQCQQMEQRLDYIMQFERQRFDEKIKALCQDVNDYDCKFFGMNADDKACFFNFIGSKVEELRTYIYEVYRCYRDIRQEEIEDLAMEEVDNIDDEKARLDINRNLVLEELEKNCQYQILQKEMDNIIQQNDFVKKRKKRFKKVHKEIKDIIRKMEIELLGEELPEEDDSSLSMKHPSEVLRESIEYVDKLREKL